MTALKFWQRVWYRHTVLVRLVDHENRIYYTLAEPQPHNTLKAYVFWGTQVAPITLMPQGTVAEDRSWIYGWEYVDVDLQLQHVLSWPEFKDVNSWVSMTHQEKWLAREQIRMATAAHGS